jgi:hypothetical protein
MLYKKEHVKSKSDEFHDTDSCEITETVWKVKLDG